MCLETLFVGSAGGLELVVVIVVQVLGGLWGQVVEGLVGASVVVEIDPPQGRRLDVVNASPGALGTDQLDLVQADR